MWRQYYSTLFNCVRSDIYVPDNVECLDSEAIFSHEVSRTINKLTDNKASGLDHITAEHIKYVSMRIAPLLAICFNAFLVHGFLLDTMISVLLVTVIKDKSGKVGCSDNYGPIALASVLF